MDKIEKALKKFSPRECEWVKSILLLLNSNELTGLNIKKLKGSSDIFRVRKGDIRIIYRKMNDRIFILKIDRRREDTYEL